MIAGTYAGHAGLVYAASPENMSQLLEAPAAWHEHAYLVQGERRISHAAFRSAIPRAAAQLSARGVARGDRVMLHSYNRPEFALATWGAWWLGAVPVYANRWWSRTEIEHAVAVTSPAQLLSDAPELLEGCGPVLYLNDLSEALHDTSMPEAPVAETNIDDPGLILFTSGSSGTPKAVELSVRALIVNQQNILVRSGRLPIADGSGAELRTSVLSTPLFHVGGSSRLLTTLLTGGRLVLTEGRFDATEVLRLIESERAHSWGGVPTMAIRVLEHPDFESYDLTSLESLPIGGAPLPPDLARRVTSKLPQLRDRGLANTWGMTETGGFATVAGTAVLRERPGTVGKPYPVVELRIDDADETGSGEILVRSPTVMLRYVGVEDGALTDDGWLRTGDVGHLDDDGYLYVGGRRKDIIIRGGENISCPQVEQHLLTHPSVAEAAAFGIPHDDLGEELVAAITCRTGRTVDAQALREHCAGKLAYFAIPTRWHISAASLPTLAGDKLDKMTIRANFMASQRAPRRGCTEC
ncbi:class I adenylate-forming enzyme family protein [Mycobacterium sp. NPDC003449]